MVRYWYGIGTVVVRYWCGIGTVLVRYWYGIGTVFVRYLVFGTVFSSVFVQFFFFRKEAGLYTTNTDHPFFHEMGLEWRSRLENLTKLIHMAFRIFFV